MKILFGILCIIGGIIFTWWTYKNPSDKPDVITADFKGYMAGIGAIALGIMLVLDYLHIV